MCRRVLALVVSLALALPAFVSQVQAQGATVTGLRYWVPVDVLVLDVTVVTTRTTDYVAVTTDKGAAELRKQTTTRATREGQLATRTLADHDYKEVLSLDAVAPKLSDTGLAVQVSAGGLLQSVNPTSKGRGAELLTSIAKFVGIAASFATGIPIGGALSLGNLAQRRLSVTLRTLEKRDPAEAAVRAAAAPPPVECNPFKAPIATQPIRVRALVSKIEPACEIFWQIQQRLDALKDFEAQRLGLESELDVTKPADLPDLRKKIGDITKAINATNGELTDWQARLMALLEAFTNEEGLGATSTTELFSTTIPLTTLVASLDKLNNDQKEFFRVSGVAVLGTRIGGADTATMSTVPATTCPAAKANESKDDKKAREKYEKDQREQQQRNSAGTQVAISFRQARPWRIEMRASRCGLMEPAAEDHLNKPCGKDDAPATATMTNTDLKNAQIVDLIAADTPVSSLAFGSAAFSDKGLSVVFDDKGRPTQLQRNGGSSVAGFATALAGAASAGRDEYAAGLEKLVEIQDSRQKLALSGIDTEIARLQKEKDLIDAKLAASSAGQSFDLLLQQNKLNAELGLLRTKLDTEAAQKTYDAQLQIELLKVKIEQMNTKVEAIKAKQDLTAAKNP